MRPSLLRTSESTQRKPSRSAGVIVAAGRSKTVRERRERPPRRNVLEGLQSESFCFVFAVLLYDIWRLMGFLLKAGVVGEMSYTPASTADECAEVIVSASIPPDRATDLPPGSPIGSGDAV